MLLCEDIDERMCVMDVIMNEFLISWQYRFLRKYYEIYLIRSQINLSSAIIYKI